jgi:hypothetical protein
LSQNGPDCPRNPITNHIGTYAAAAALEKEQEQELWEAFTLVFDLENVERGTPAELRHTREQLRRGLADRGWGDGGQEEEDGATGAIGSGDGGDGGGGRKDEEMRALRRAFVVIYGAEAIAGKSDAALRRFTRANRAKAAKLSMPAQTSPNLTPSSPTRLPLLAAPPPPVQLLGPQEGRSEGQQRPLLQQPPLAPPQGGDHRGPPPAGPARAMCPHCLGDFVGELWLSAHLQFNLCPAFNPWLLASPRQEGRARPATKCAVCGERFAEESLVVAHLASGACRGLPREPQQKQQQEPQRVLARCGM